MNNIKVYVILVALFVAFLPARSLAQSNSNAIVQAAVEFAFMDLPEMVGIAKCESGFRQFNADGSPLRGSGRYIGIFQIDEPIHAAKALSMGYDINTIDGNINYARHLRLNSGTAPWKGCLGGSVVPSSSVSPATGPVSVNLNIGMNHPQVSLLQKILNKLGYTVSPSGPGAPGQETNYFGNLTREAVKRFQCAKNIACSGNESSTGYGRVGPMTRAMLNSLN